MRAIERSSWFLFRYRNIVFPVLLIGLLFLFPPIPSTTGPTVALTALGLVLLVVGQGLRLITIGIGLDYIWRSGINRQFYANNLVTGGLFEHCRNPMYTGNVLIATGFMVLTANAWTIIIGSLASYLIYAAIIHGEECYLAREFGAAFAHYCADVPRWPPRLRGLLTKLRTYPFDWQAVIVREYGTMFTTALTALIILGVKSARADHWSASAPGYVAAAVILTFLYALARYLKKSRRLRARRS